MENYITTFPDIYWEQIYEQARKNKLDTINENEEDTTKAASNIPTSKYSDLPQTIDKSKLLETVSPAYLFEQKRYLKKINQIWEKENQACVEVILGSPLKSEGFDDLSTNFWLYKEKDGYWRIFLIQSTVMNENYAR